MHTISTIATSVDSLNC